MTLRASDSLSHVLITGGDHRDIEETEMCAVDGRCLLLQGGCCFLWRSFFLAAVCELQLADQHAAASMSMST